MGASYPGSIAETDPVAESDLAAHVAAADPHTQYQKESEKGAANGYASLDGSGLVPTAQLPITAPSDASTTVKGISKLSVAPASPTAPIAVGDNDPRNTNTRTPTDASVTDAKIATTLSPSKITGTAVVTADSRLSDARTPTAHASSHASAGSDPITIAESQVTNLTTDLAAKAAGLTPSAVKTANYSAAAGDFIPVDASSGSVTITLPTAPADKTRIAVKMIAVASTNTVTINRGGTDVFNKSGGSTSLTLSLLNQGTILQYQSSSGIWYVQSTDVPLSGLDARFAALASPTFTGTPAAPTAAQGTNTTQLATTAYVQTEFGLVRGVNTQTVDYTLALTDAGKVVEMNAATTKTFTVPPNSSVAFPVGTVLRLVRYGAGSVKITPGAGVTFNAPITPCLIRTKGTVSLVKRGTDEWELAGDLFDPLALGPMGLLLPEGLAAFANNAAITAWQNAAAGGAAIQNAATQQPLCKTGVLNGFSVADFDGTNDVLFATGWHAGITPHHVLAVVLPTDFTVARAIIGTVSAAAGLEVRHTITSGRIASLKEGIAAIGTSNADLTAAQWAIVEATFDGTNYAFYRNGTAEGTGTNVQTLTQTYVGTLIGAASDAGTSDPFKGQMAAVFRGGSVLATADAKDLRAFMGAKFGITVA